MKILIDIKHPAQLNLFKGLARELAAEKWEVTVCYLNRGKLPKIIAAEYAGFHTIPVGSSNGSKWSIIWNGNIKRAWTFLHLIKKNRYDICIAVSSVPLALASKMFSTPVIQFNDDPERRQLNYINARLSNQLFFPPIVQKNNKTSTFNCLKEWSYLSPKRFQPDEKVLTRYALSPYEYVFMREVSNKSFNYYSQQNAIISGFSHKLKGSAKVVLSLEDKSIAGTFPTNWTILEEPVEDIHSLIYYSKLVVSSGDSMAREGAMLGVPSIYCGFREMKANEILINMGILKHLPGQQAVPRINQIMDQVCSQREKLRIRNGLMENWDDMIVFMKEQINHYKKVN